MKKLVYFSRFFVLASAWSFVQYASGQATTVFFDNMEDGGASAQGEWSSILVANDEAAGADNTWEYGEPIPFEIGAYGGAVPCTGPDGAYSGSNCWGTNLDGLTAGVPAVGYLTSPSIDLTGKSAATLSFYMWIQSEHAGDILSDAALLEISTDNGEKWEQVPGDFMSVPYEKKINTVGGNAYVDSMAWGYEDHMEWTRNDVIISSYVGNTVKFRFVYSSDNGDSFSGMYIDDFLVEASSSTGLDGVNNEDLIQISAASSDIKLVLSESATIHVYDVAGQLLYSGIQSEGEVILPLNLAKGTYLVQAVSLSGNSKTEKVSI